MVEGNTAHPLNSNERRSMQVRGHRTNQLAEVQCPDFSGEVPDQNRGWLPWEDASPRTDGNFDSRQCRPIVVPKG